jgi:acetolactate synthase-1/2/3 large subunit
MKASEYIADYLIRHGVTDAFGIPGGVVLELLYALDARRDEIAPHLCYHEQSAGFAACGYAQAGGRLGVAYATKGPGFTNLLTPMADAYCDSLPVLFLTAHSAALNSDMRVMNDQEIDTVSMAKNITKFAARIDDAASFQETFEQACRMAMSGRKGPVFLDISTAVLKSQIDIECIDEPHVADSGNEIIPAVVSDIADSIRSASRPVILIGDGINQSQLQDEFRKLIEMLRIPVLSSRFSHDVACASPYYFGYVGSRAIRSANFILSKADLVVALGNRMHYPVKSESFSRVTNRAKVIRVEIDETEFNREVMNAVNYCADISDVVAALNGGNHCYGSHAEWLSVCNTLKAELCSEDVNPCVEAIASILRRLSPDTNVVNDVGNNEFFVSRASVLTELPNRVMYSKSFGALGCGLGKAIGVHYATHSPVACIVGDQGLQMNIQELQFIAQHHLPIAVVLINNQSSGMIKDREKLAGYAYSLHTTSDSGYANPDFKTIAKGYGVAYKTLEELSDISIQEPLFIEVAVDENLMLTPTLPRGAECQDLYPQIDRRKYDYLNSL